LERERLALGHGVGSVGGDEPGQALLN
jgi:hypothetical protein